MGIRRMAGAGGLRRTIRGGQSPNGPLLSWTSGLAAYTNASGFARSIMPNATTYYGGNGAWTAGVPAIITLSGRNYIQVEKPSDNFVTQSDTIETGWSVVGGSETLTDDVSSAFNGQVSGHELVFDGSAVSGMSNTMSAMTASVTATVSAIVWSAGSVTFRLGFRDKAGTLNWSGNLTATTTPTLYQAQFSTGIGAGVPRTYIGNDGASSTGTIFLNKIQCEESAFATSRIISAGSKTTRNADVLSYASPPASILAGKYTIRGIPYHADTDLATGQEARLLSISTTRRVAITDTAGAKRTEFQTTGGTLAGVVTWSRYAGPLLLTPDHPGNTFAWSGFDSGDNSTSGTVNDWATATMYVGSGGGTTHFFNGLVAEPEAA